ncbi:MAG: hypothetical protein E5Y73_07560 [Mesorhizobium sp.]|uniref:hypothetical protein n=1 Tax=Mesorhizobium sp. TaxID=1871066 RepID=UPI00122BF6C3|nr:hypothetical protein [Mesorhizobium sp.]TIL95207.1 MAG: hypothetical protein E5Y73_07560 [Mesorhizobium sp.]
MTMAPRKSRPAAGTAGAAEHESAEKPKAYAGADGRARADKIAFTAFKFEWLRQVALDPSMPPAASPIAILLADEYLNQETGDAWPAVDTLARQLGRGKTQTRAALQAMDGIHLSVDWTAGGKGQTNRYRPIRHGETLRISGGLQTEGTKGTFVPNPPENDDQTLRKSDRKPSGIPEGNPYEGIPLKETQASGGAPRARPPSAPRRFHSSSTLETGDGARASLAPSYFPDGYNIGVEVDLPGEGFVIIGERVGDLMRARNICGELVSFRREDGMFVIVGRERAR